MSNQDRDPSHGSAGDALTGAASGGARGAWVAFVVGGFLVGLVRLAAAGAPWAGLIDAAWGLACAAAFSIRVARSRGLARLGWSLFLVAVACGATSMALFGPAADAPAIHAFRAVLDLGAYACGALGIAVLLRHVGGSDPDGWLDAAAVGVVVSLALYELAPGMAGSAAITGRGEIFALLVAVVNAAVVTTLVRLVIRPAASPSLAVLGTIIAAALVVDLLYYTTLRIDRPLFEATWIVAYGAWAAAALHPDAARLVALTPPVPTGPAGVVRHAFASITIHTVGLVATMLLLVHHAGSGAVTGAWVFLAAYSAQIALVAARSVRLVRRLADDDAARVRAEAALRASEERFRQLAEVAPVGIFVADEAGRSVFQNRAWGALAGIPAEAGLNRGYEDAIHPDDRERALGAWQRSVSDHRPFDVEHRVLRPDGGIAWVHSTAAPLSDSAGRTTGWVGTVSDVTGLVEARLLAQEREAFISGLIEQAPVGIEVFDPSGRTISANRAQREFRAQVAPGERTGHDIREDPLMLRLGQREAIEAALAGDAAGAPDPIRIDVAPSAADDGPRWVWMTWFPLLGEDGRVAAVISFLEDATATVRAEEERRAVEAKLREAATLEALGVLAGGMAHDFNNLLVAILGHASMARSQLPPGSSLDEDLASVETAAQRAADLARQMLAYSGRGTFRVGAVSVEGLLREMGDLLGRSIAKHATLRYAFTPDLPPVLADPTQLRQVALNLIVNASDALGDRPGTITLRTALATVDEHEPDAVPGIPVVPGTYVLLEVADTGRGMDAATVRRIFDPFFTTKATGRGLGLAATLGIVKGHGGLIRVRSEPGVGTTFGVLLPPADATAGPIVGGTPQAPDVAAPASDGAGGRILIVDDEATVRAIGRRVLERAGYEVEEAADGPDGIAAFAGAPASWSAVLLDLTLPTLDGMAVLAAVRELRPGIPAVICSGWAAEEVAARLVGMERVVILEKPYPPAALVDAFRRSLDGGSPG
jgi:PAS domain S-box-containing protein